ncbi:MAG TPA: cytochrome c3 family protein [Verrucomicrobiae bacterium]|nr:cytochrome c3 family protein [Verrucomicrobiae bacterium]
MSDIFPKWTNKLPGRLLLGVVLLGAAASIGVTYYFTPKYTDVGYQPTQPVYFPHSVHADQLGIDCRYCHNDVEKSWYSNIPGSGVCMNCHNQVLVGDPRLAPIRASATNNTSVPWVQIHKMPDFVYFNHSVHVNRGISCVHCHGQVNKLDEVRQLKPLSMAFCLDCHRDPGKNIRPPEQVFNLDWQRPKDFNGQNLVEHWNVHPPQSCSACHR